MRCPSANSLGSIFPSSWSSVRLLLGSPLSASPSCGIGDTGAPEGGSIWAEGPYGWFTSAALRGISRAAVTLTDRAFTGPLDASANPTQPADYRVAAAADSRSQEGAGRGTGGF
jgi:hypothetical protein